MPYTRRTFLQSAALTPGIAGAASSVAAQLTRSAAEIEVPKMKFGAIEISRMVVGCNPFYGFSHFNNILSTKTCFVFKILAAGRIDDHSAAADQAFQTAFESIKPIDGIFVGMFPRMKDEVKENAERVHRS